MKPELTAEIKKQQLQKKYAEAAELFTSAVYEQPDSLQASGRQAQAHPANGQQVRSACLAPSRPNAKGLLANPKLLAAIFSSAMSTDKKRNTEAVDMWAAAPWWPPA
jgi:peptidyl-prolyl cis-trans isomerase D